MLVLRADGGNSVCHKGENTLFNGRKTVILRRAVLIHWRSGLHGAQIFQTAQCALTGQPHGSEKTPPPPHSVVLS